MQIYEEKETCINHRYTLTATITSCVPISPDEWEKLIQGLRMSLDTDENLVSANVEE